MSEMPVPDVGEPASQARQEFFGSQAAATPSQGVTLKAYFLDQFGKEHLTVTHTTLPEHVLVEKGAVIRQAVERMYADLGMVLLSLQREVESEPVVLAEAAEPVPEPRRHIRLVSSNGKRIMSQEVRVLMQSAGMSEAQARQALYGEESEGSEAG